MPEWMHSRAEHILAKNPSMPKGEAFAIATQQMHALGKGPKGYGTAAGKREAKKKFDTPKDDEHTANPGGLRSEKMEYEKKASTLEGAMYSAFFDELSKIAALPPPLPAAALAANAVGKVKKPLTEMGQAFMHGAINNSLKPNANPLAHMKL